MLQTALNVSLSVFDIFKKGQVYPRSPKLESSIKMNKKGTSEPGQQLKIVFMETLHCA